MKAGPLRPAQVEFRPGEPPWAPGFGDHYHPRSGALAQARHVFLAGNGLPARWQGRGRFTFMETGFGLGLNFIAAWSAWRADSARPERLHWVSLELHPATAATLAEAHALALEGRVGPEPVAVSPPAPEDASALAAELRRAWPPLAPGLHQRAFDGGRVVLTLGFGDALALLPQLRLEADALVLDGFAPDRNPALWSPPLFKSLARLAAPGCTAATWSVARAVRDGLSAAGFEVGRAPGMGGKREITTARFAPRHVPRGPAPLRAPGLAEQRRALVVGAGLAGAAVARALARQGVSVEVFDRAEAPAAAASGNPAGLFHATVNADDGPYARLFRAAALHAAPVYREAIAGGVPGALDGVLRLASSGQGLGDMQAMLQGQGQPAEVAQALPADEASRCAGVPLAVDAWLYPEGGWIDPGAWVRAVLGNGTPQAVPAVGDGDAAAAGRIRFRGGVEVGAMRRGATGWTLLDAGGQALASAPLVVLANADGAARLWPAAGWALARRRGQLTWWNADEPEAGSAKSPARLRRPLAGDGYAIPLDAGGSGRMLCGATRQDGDDDTRLRDTDHRANILRFERLTGLSAPADPSLWQGRVGWRVHSDDRLPLAGGVPAEPGGIARHRLTQARHWPREPGLFVLAALGARGLTLAPLLGELVAAQALGTPWPLEQALADAVDPVRWWVREARAAPVAGRTGHGGLAGGAAGAPADIGNGEPAPDAAARSG